MASWTNETRLGGSTPGIIADLRDLVASWLEMARELRARAGELTAEEAAIFHTRDRMLAVADTYRRCADELDRRIPADDVETD